MSQRSAPLLFWLRPAGCNDGLVPLIRKNDKTSSLSEERRLFYVSLTRAKQRLRLSHTRESNHYGSSGG